MAEYSFNNWPRNELGRPERVVGTVYFVDESIGPDPLRVRAQPDNAGTIAFSSLHDGQKVARIDIDHVAYKGIVEAMMVENDADHLETFVHMLAMIDKYLRKHGADAWGFYSRDTALEAEKVRFTLKTDEDNQTMLFSTLVGSAAVFAHAERVAKEAGQQVAFESTLYAAFSSARSRNKDALKERMAEYLARKHPATANPATLALFFEDGYDEVEDIRIAAKRIFEAKSEGRLDLPSGIAE